MVVFKTLMYKNTNMYGKGLFMWNIRNIKIKNKAILNFLLDMQNMKSSPG